MARYAAAVLLVIALGAQVTLAQYGTGSTKTGAGVEQRGSYTAGRDRFYVTSVNLADLKGVWVQEGMEAPKSQATAEEESALPDCANDGLLPSYMGLDYDAARFTVLAGATNATNLMNVNQQRSTFSPNVTFAAPFIVSTNAATGAKTCTHWQAYVDVASGELLAESLSINVWSKNTTEGAKAPVRARPTCDLTGREQVGCYTGAVTLGAQIPQAPATAPSVAISSIPGVAPAAARPDGSIVTISKNTFKCAQGECLRLSPKHSSTSPAYGCN